jgi:hypothetical protein
MVKVKANLIDRLKELLQYQLREAGANTQLTLMMADKSVGRQFFS